MRPTALQLLNPLLNSLFDKTHVSTPAQLLAELDKMGLIDLKAAEALYAKREVDRLVRQGRGRCRAMEDVAETLCCSYEKVRKIVYSE